MSYKNISVQDSFHFTEIKNLIDNARTAALKADFLFQ